MNSITIIPARMGSSRFPGKPLEKIHGFPMIEHVYRRSKQAKLTEETIVATCDKEIFDFIISIGGEAIMTSNDHQRASDRCSEALMSINKKSSVNFDSIVMVQGDEPLVDPDQIDKTVDLFNKQPKTFVSNFAGPFHDVDELQSKNSIKVVASVDGNALYFSRNIIPFVPESNLEVYKKQVCIIGFSNNTLSEYSKLSTTSLEEMESIDMLRVIQHGHKVKLIFTNKITLPVDVKSDIQRVENLIEQDALYFSLFRSNFYS